MSEDIRWMTYAEAATALGVDEDSVQRRAQRRGWRRMTGNDRRVRVAVPTDLIPDGNGEGDVSPDIMLRVPAAFAALLADALDRERKAGEELAEVRQQLAEVRQQLEVQTARLRDALNDKRILTGKGLVNAVRRVAFFKT